MFYGDAMGWFSDIVSGVGDAVQSVVDTTTHAIDVATRHPVETAALVVAAPYAYEAATATAATGSLAPVSDAIALTPEQILAKSIPSDVGIYGAGNAGFEFAAPSAVSTAPVSESFLSNVTARDVLTATNTGLNLAGTGLKLAALSNTGKLMTLNNATANGLTGALGISPIQTPSGLITTTPNGPVVAGTSVPATAAPMMLDQQSMMVIAGAVLGLFLLTKYAKG